MYVRVKNFNLGHNFWTFRDRHFIFCIQFTNAALLNDSKVGEIVIINVTLILKITSLDFGTTGAQAFHKHI